jgi:Cd2+/Zn2+-exporting ATPase
MEEHSGQNSEFLIGGMDCPSCALTVEKAVKGIEGIYGVQVNYNTSKMQVFYNDEKNLDKLPDTIKKLGHTIEPFQTSELWGSFVRNEAQQL